MLTGSQNSFRRCRTAEKVDLIWWVADADLDSLGFGRDKIYAQKQAIVQNGQTFKELKF